MWMRKAKHSVVDVAKVHCSLRGAEQSMSRGTIRNGRLGTVEATSANGP